MPLISIIIPTYNRAHIIEKTLTSVQQQTLTDWECLVIDDFSKDNTKEIVTTLCVRDNRFQYFINENKKGAQGARNTGINHAQGEWIEFFDSDDIMHADLLESIFCAMREDNTQSDVYTCFSNVINHKTQEIVGTFKWICEGDIREKILCGESYVDFNGAVIRKQKLLDIGCLDENCPSMQEWDTHIRLSKIARYHTVPEILVEYFVGGEDAISSDSKREIVGRLYILKKHQREWRKNKESHINYVKDIHRLIKNHPSRIFRAKTTFKLLTSAPSVQWISLKRRIKSVVNSKHNE